LKRDVVSERLELVDEVAGLAVFVDAAGVEVGAEVVVAGGGVGRWPAVGNWVMSSPTSAMMTWAARTPMPVISSSRATTESGALPGSRG
jgi:hypothetical protein